MASESDRRHVFISHHHKDDESVTNLTSLLNKGGYDIRNSSIRAKPENQARLDKKQVSDKTIQRLLRMKMSWASTVVVLVGKDTHSRPWVNWEIEQANRMGKRIVGIFDHGGKQADVPTALEKYGAALVGWNTGKIIAAIDGQNSFENPDGSTRAPINTATTSTC